MLWLYANNSNAANLLQLLSALAVSKLHKTIIFETYLTGQYHFFNFLLKSTRFGALCYKLD
jgi:hypothetical protein